MVCRATVEEKVMDEVRYDVWMTKREARAVVTALDYCDAAFGLGKMQSRVRQRIVRVWPDLDEDKPKESV